MAAANLVAAIPTGSDGAAGFSALSIATGTGGAGGRLPDPQGRKCAGSPSLMAGCGADDNKEKRYDGS